MPGARLGRAGLGPQRATGQRQTRPTAGWPIWEQGCLQIAAAIHWVWDKALGVYIYREGSTWWATSAPSSKREVIKGF